MQLLMNRSVFLHLLFMRDSGVFSEQEAGDLHWFPVTIEPLLQFTVLDEMMEAFYLDLSISGYHQQLEKPSEK